MLLPVAIDTPPREADAQAASTVSRTVNGTIEIDIGGTRVRLRGAVDETSVRIVLQALRGLE